MIPRFVIILLAVCALSNCASLIIKPLEAMTPSPLEDRVPTGFDMTPPPGPANYQQGFKDGCESGLNSTNELVSQEYRQFQYRLNQQLAGDPVYYRVWRDAYDYCAFTMLTIMKYTHER